MTTITRFSFAALPATIAASTTFVDAVHPASNVLLPLRPHLRAYSASTSAQRLTLDLGTATVLDVVGLIHGNFLTATIQGHATDTWGTPSYNSGAITLGRSRNGRYHYKHFPTTFAYRYLSLSIPTQATTDGAPYFSLGVLWPGRLVSPPGELLTDPDEENQEAFKDLKTADGRSGPRLVLDDPAWHFSARRAAEDEAELNEWDEIDFQWSAAPGQAALVCYRDDAYTAEVYVMRKAPSKWRHGTHWMESPFECHEVTRG